MNGAYMKRIEEKLSRGGGRRARGLEGCLPTYLSVVEMVDRTRVRGALHCGDEEEQNIKSHERNRKEEYQHCRHCCSRIGLLCLAYSILMVILLIAFPPLRLTPLASTVKLRQNSKLGCQEKRIAETKKLCK